VPATELGGPATIISPTSPKQHLCIAAIRTWCASRPRTRHNAWVGVWDELTPQQWAVMFCAIGEHCLNQVIYEFHARRFWNANGGNTSQPPDPLAEPEVRLLIPEFADIVLDLIGRNWIEIREPWIPWDAAPAMTEQEITQTLADPDSWIWDENGGRRMVGLMTTELWKSFAAA
jgi:hypothetical protein